MFELLRDPPAAADVTALPLDYYPVDAAVLYNDLSTPFLAAGLEVEMKAGVGPVVDRPIYLAADIERLEPFEPRDRLGYILEQIRLLAGRLDVPVIGFVGAPFTLCSYLIKGRKARSVDELKAFIWREPDAWSRLAGFWAQHMAEFAVAQHEAGAGAVQVFDSWAGALAPADYETHVLSHMRDLLRRLDDAGVPSIHFATGNPALLPLISEAGGDCVAVDWRVPIDEAWEAVGRDRAIQGNLDPAALLAGRETAIAQSRRILDRIGGRPGHIFNLGHGILPNTDPDVIRAVVDFVHEFTA